MTSISDLGKNGGQGYFPLSECLSSGAAWLPVGLSVCLSPTFGTLAQVPCGMQGWCCAGGNRARQLAKRRVMVVVAAMRGGAGVGQPEGSGEEQKEGEKGRRQEGRKPKKVGRHRRAGVVGVGRWSPVSGSPSTLVWGWISVHFVFLHTV